MESYIFIFTSLFVFLKGVNSFAKRKYYHALLALIFLFTDGFDVVPQPGGALSYGNVGLVLMICYLFIVPSKQIRFQSLPLEKLFTYFALYFVICICFSLFHHGFAFPEVMRVTKWLIPFWSIYLFRLLSEKEFNRLMRTLLVITVILNVFFIIQAIWNVSVFVSAHSGGIMGGIHRYYNKPIFSTFFLFFLLFHPYSKFIANRKMGITVLAIALLVTFNRLEIISVVVGYMVCIFLQRGMMQKISRLMLLPFLLIPVLLVMQVRDETSNSSGSGDLQAIMNGEYRDYVQEAGSATGGTMTFRIAMLYERIDYMSSKASLSEVLLGLGLGHSDYDKVYKKYNFQIGTYTGLGIGKARVSQLSSGDMAWVSMLCQWGVVGLVFFCIIYYRMCAFFIKRRTDNWAFVCTGYLVYLALCSFAGGFAIEANFYLLTFAVYYHLAIPVTNNRVVLA